MKMGKNLLANHKKETIMSILIYEIFELLWHFHAYYHHIYRKWLTRAQWTLLLWQRRRRTKKTDFKWFSLFFYEWFYEHVSHSFELYDCKIFEEINFESCDECSHTFFIVSKFLLHISTINHSKLC